jgi:uncharacterized protein YheU (UPF0270 family)
MKIDIPTLRQLIREVLLREEAVDFATHYGAIEQSLSALGIEDTGEIMRAIQAEAAKAGGGGL